MANNETVGSVTCPHCKANADVKINAKQKYYYHCKACGIANLHGARFQQFIKEKAIMYATPVTKGGGEPEEKPVEEVQPPHAEKPAKKGALAWTWLFEEEEEA